MFYRFCDNSFDSTILYMVEMMIVLKKKVVSMAIYVYR